MAKKKLTDLLDKALGISKEETEDSVEDLIGVARGSAPVIETVTPGEIIVASPEPIPTTVHLHKAYNLYYDKEAKNYVLVTVLYSVDGNHVRAEKSVIADNLPEANYKFNKIFIDKLKDSLYNK